MELTDICCFYVSFLRSLYTIHQNHHWLAKGKNSYGDHLLFERIYQSAQENADLAAEKIVGLFGDECILLEDQNKCMHGIIGKFDQNDDLAGVSLAAEKKFLDFSKSFYDALKKADKLTLGLDDCIMQIASKREEAVYLLQQTGKKVASKRNLMSDKINVMAGFRKKEENGMNRKSSITSVKERFIKKLAQTANINLKQIETALNAMVASANPGAFSLRIKQEGNQLLGTLFLETKPGTNAFKLDSVHQEKLLSIMRKTVNEQLVKQLGQMPMEFSVDFKILPLSDLSKMAQSLPSTTRPAGGVDLSPTLTQKPQQPEMQGGKWVEPSKSSPAQTLPETTVVGYPPIPKETQNQLNQLLVPTGKIFPIELDGKLGPETAKAIALFKSIYQKPATVAAIKDTYLAQKNPELETKFPA